MVIGYLDENKMSDATIRNSFATYLHTGSAVAFKKVLSHISKIASYNLLVGGGKLIPTQFTTFSQQPSRSVSSYILNPPNRRGPMCGLVNIKNTGQ